MKQDLNALKTEIEQAIVAKGLVLFRGLGRGDEALSAIIHWDTERYPAYEDYLAAAAALDSKIVVLHDLAFSGDQIDETAENLESLDLPRDEYRDYERRLARLREYAGFTCLIELSFEHNADTYVFELIAPWYRDFLDLDDEIDALAGPSFDDDDDDEEDPGPLGGFYSKN
jgi:hypothetical protein